MALSAVLFDLDGTLLPMDQQVFANAYFKSLAATLAPHGYQPEAVLNAVWTGIRSMVKNDGSRSNEEAFWETFAGILGSDVLNHRSLLDNFYRTTFQDIRTVCGVNARAAETVAALKRRGVRLVLATNPLFPAVATESRIRWAGLSPEDFELVTTYENIGFCKPNPAYYQSILNRIGCPAEECLMVGNDVAEDMVAQTLGMRVFLLTDCLINTTDRDISSYPRGGFDQLAAFLDTL